MAESFSIRGVSKHTIIYGLGPIFQKSIGFLLLPVYTHYLTPSDYGILELIRITIAIWIMVANQGMGTAFFRYYPWENPEKEPQCVSTAFFYIVFSGIALVVVSLILIEAMDDALLRIDDRNIETLLYLAVWSGFFQIIVIVPYQKLRAQQRSTAYVIANTLGFAANLGLNILFIVVYHLGVFGLLLGNMLAAIILAMALTASIRKNLDIKQFSSRLMKKMVRYGYPLIPGGFSYFLLSIMDRLFIQSMCTTTDLGLYSLGAKITNILGIVLVGPFLLVWPSIYFPWSKTEEGGEALAKVGRLFFGLLCTGALLLALAAPVMIKTITGAKFWGAYHYVPLLLVGQLGWGYFNLKNIGFSINNKTQYLPITLVVATALNAGLNYIFILKMGAMGAALATAVSYLLLCVFSDVWARRYYKLKMPDVRVILGFLCFIITTYLFYTFGFANLPLVKSMVAATAFGAVGTFLLGMSALNRRELSKVAAAVGQIASRIGISFS